MEITVPFASYKLVRFLAVFGGLIGVLQAVIWLGLSITGVLGFYCHIDFTGTSANFGTVLQLTLFHMYFQGECTVNDFPIVDFEPIERLNLMEPWVVNIWMWVVIGLSTLWLFSSLTLITNVKKSNLKYANVTIYLWVLITFAISIIDLVLFILFVIDYETLLSHSLRQSLNFASSASSILLSAQVAVTIMYSVALRGYVLWIINMVITLYLFTQTFKIYDYNKLVESGATENTYINNAYKSDNINVQAAINNQAIRGYENQNHPWYNYLTTDIPRARPPTLIRSTSTSVLDDGLQKRSEPRSQATVDMRRDNNSRMSNVNNTGYIQTPQPNFEPKPQLRGGILRNSRYQ